MPRKPDPVRDAAVTLAAVLKYGNPTTWAYWWEKHAHLAPDIADRFLTPATAKPRRARTAAQVQDAARRRALRALDNAGLPRALRDAAQQAVTDGTAEVVES